MLRALILPIMFAGAACSPPTPSTAQPSTQAAPQGDMRGMTMPAATTAQAGVIASTGTVTQVDAAAGTVTLDHQAIPGINWPAMTMQFHTEDPAVLSGVSVGDHVSFQLKSTAEPEVLVAIHKQ